METSSIMNLDTVALADVKSIGYLPISAPNMSGKLALSEIISASGNVVIVPMGYASVIYDAVSQYLEQGACIIGLDDSHRVYSVESYDTTYKMIIFQHNSLVQTSTTTFAALSVGQALTSAGWMPSASQLVNLVQVEKVTELPESPNENTLYAIVEE